MNKVLGSALVLAVLAGLSYYFYNDYQFRKLNGQVVSVGLTNWESEVETASEAKPVLVYLYRGDESPEQRQAVESAAWKHAGEVQVVSVDVTRPEMVILALRFGVLRFPAYAVLRDGQVCAASSGVAIDRAAIDRLIQKAMAEKLTPSK